MDDRNLAEGFGAERDRERWLRPALRAPWWEIVLVLTVMLGPFAYSSVHFALQKNPGNFIVRMMSNRSFLHNLALESGLLAVFYLRWRGWKAADFKIRIDWMGTAASVPVAIAAGVANAFTAMVLTFGVIWSSPNPQGALAAFMARSPHIPHHSIEIAWSLIFLGSIVNAFLEELVFMGYAFNQFAARRGPLFALLCMVFLRMLLHTYKGPLDMLGIAAFSFVYGLAYQYLRRLWPLILGHACIDLAAFAALKIIFGR